MEKPSSFFEHEQEPTLELLFSQLIDTKFAEGRANRSATRDHEETLKLLATHQLALCPTATSFLLTRPIPEEYELAMQRWSHFGGPRAFVAEFDNAGGSTQTHLFVIGNTMYARRFHYAPYDHAEDDSQAINQTHAEAIFEWINTAIPDL